MKIQVDLVNSSMIMRLLFFLKKKKGLGKKKGIRNKYLPWFMHEKANKILCLQTWLSYSLSVTSLQMQNPRLLLSDLLMWNSITFGILPKYLFLYK